MICKHKRLSRWKTWSKEEVVRFVGFEPTNHR
jgi:hypothetical protein